MKHFQTKNIRLAESMIINDLYDSLCNRIGFCAYPAPELWAVDSQRGYASQIGRNRIVTAQRITIPLHAFRRDKIQAGYLEYYLSHELAHLLAGCFNNHNSVFMHWLKRICKPEFLHYETEYKPRNAQAAGISSLRSLNSGITADDL